MKNTSKSIRLKWGKVKDASGYVIYRNNKKVKTINSAKKKTWVDKKCKRNKTYKYRIRAFVKRGKKKSYGAYSISVSAKTYTKNSKRVNVGTVEMDLIDIDLNVCEKTKNSVVVKKSKYAKRKKAVPLSKKVRWYSSNSKIAAVDKNGTIQAQNTADLTRSF